MNPQRNSDDRWFISYGILVIFIMFILGILLLWLFSNLSVMVYGANPVPATAPEVVFESPTRCSGPEAGEYRWDVKTDTELPATGDFVPSVCLTPSDIAKWPFPEGKFTSKTKRSGREKTFWQVKGWLIKMRVERDRDIHCQLCDEGDPSSMQMVVEVPYGEEWDEIRTDLFNLTTVKFPFKIQSGKWLTLQDPHPLVIFRGKAFWDNPHATHGVNVRSEDHRVCVWEIHPAMYFKVVK